MPVDQFGDRRHRRARAKLVESESLSDPVVTLAGDAARLLVRAELGVELGEGPGEDMQQVRLARELGGEQPHTRRARESSWGGWWSGSSWWKSGLGR